jgi:hypothetical protein
MMSAQPIPTVILASAYRIGCAHPGHADLHESEPAARFRPLPVFAAFARRAPWSC